VRRENESSGCKRARNQMKLTIKVQSKSRTRPGSETRVTAEETKRDLRKGREEEESIKQIPQ
jgi:hypothetical protein